MENRLIPVDVKDLETQGMISVQRLRVTGANTFGRPDVEEAGEEYFMTLESALEWSMKSPEYAHLYNIPLPQLELSAELDGPRGVKGMETLIVKQGNMIGESPRSVEGHHAVSTDYQNFFNLVIHLEPGQGPIFDRGVVWVDLADNSSPHALMFQINAGIHTRSELEGEILQMLVRANTVMNDLLQESAE